MQHKVFVAGFTRIADDGVRVRLALIVIAAVKRRNQRSGDSIIQRGLAAFLTIAVGPGLADDLHRQCARDVDKVGHAEMIPLIRRFPDGYSIVINERQQNIGDQQPAEGQGHVSHAAKM